MHTKGYNIFCPLSFASSMLEPRWTMLIVLEMSSGSTRFSDIQRGVPGMSSSLLSRRLKEMVASGLLARDVHGDGSPNSYLLTPMARELVPVILQLGVWAHRHVDSKVALECLDHHLLMWNIRRAINLQGLPPRKSVVQFILKEPRKKPVNYWLILRPVAEPDLCVIDPKHEVDLYVTADLRALTSAWMGHSTLAHEIAADRIVLIGNRGLADTLTQWLMRSSYANDPRPMLRRSA